MSGISNRQIRISPHQPVFTLPVHVGIREGLFEKEGLDVAFSTDYRGEDSVTCEQDVFSRLKESQFVSNASDGFNLCEWGGLHRSETSQRSGKVLGLRAAVVAMAIVTFDKQIQELKDLLDVPVGMNEHTGSHYTAIQMLEGALPKDRIRVNHVGGPMARLEGLKKGSSRATTLMEPYLSAALKEGAHIVSFVFFRGAEIISSDWSPQEVDAYIKAQNKAVEYINEDPQRYAPIILENEPIENLLAPDEINFNWLRYVPVRPYRPDEFNLSYEWMHTWGLTGGQNQYGQLVSNLLSS